MKIFIAIISIFLSSTFLKAQESEPEFIKLLKERFTIPELAKRGGVEADILLKVNKTAKSDSVAIAYNNAEIYLRQVYAMLKDTLWRKSLIIGEYYIHFKVIESFPTANNDLQITEEKCIIDSITRNSKIYFAQVFTPQVHSQRPEKRVYYQRPIKIVHDSLLSLYYNSPETIWNSEKKKYDKSNSKIKIEDSTDVVLSCEINTGMNVERYFKICKKLNGDIILSKTLLFDGYDSLYSYKQLYKNLPNDEYDYKRSCEFFEKFKTFPNFYYPNRTCDGVGYILNFYDSGFYRNYKYDNPQSTPEVKICALFENIKENYLSLFEF